ncbi:hypothetical protein BC835DRAFT_1311823 [Cytidiella melzeri]|nr:hypothetical protein BC835DRAFT_1311823 [Cytidiella melzeri]
MVLQWVACIGLSSHWQENHGSDLCGSHAVKVVRPLFGSVREVSKQLDAEYSSDWYFGRNIQLYSAESNSGTLSQWCTLALNFSIPDAMSSSSPKVRDAKKSSTLTPRCTTSSCQDISLGSQKAQIGRSQRDGSAGSLLVQTWPSGRGGGVSFWPHGLDPDTESIHALTAPPETDINGAGLSVVDALLSPTAEMRLRISSRSSCNEVISYLVVSSVSLERSDSTHKSVVTRFNSARTNIVSWHSFVTLPMSTLLRFVVALLNTFTVWLAVPAEVEGGQAGVSIGPKDMDWRLLIRSREATEECLEESNTGMTRPDGLTEGVHECDNGRPEASEDDDVPEMLEGNGSWNAERSPPTMFKRVEPGKSWLVWHAYGHYGEAVQEWTRHVAGGDYRTGLGNQRQAATGREEAESALAAWRCLQQDAMLEISALEDLAVARYRLRDTVVCMRRLNNSGARCQQATQHSITIAGTSAWLFQIVTTNTHSQSA